MDSSFINDGKIYNHYDTLSNSVKVDLSKALTAKAVLVDFFVTA